MEKPYSALRVGTGFWMRGEGLRERKIGNTITGFIGRLVRGSKAIWLYCLQYARGADIIESVIKMSCWVNVSISLLLMTPDSTF